MRQQENSMNPKLNKIEGAPYGPRNKPAEIYGFDRVGLWLSVPDLPIEQALLEEHCAKIAVVAHQMPYQARWKLQVSLHQPTTECLHLLQQALGSAISVQIEYVEIDCDVLAKTPRQALEWQDAFLATAHMRHQRQTVVRFLNTWYWGRRANRSGRRAKTLAVYADKPSKLNNARPAADALPCLHIELRADGVETSAILGLVSIQDLIDIDYPMLWEKVLRLYELPKPTALGRLLAKLNHADTEVSGTALRNRAARWKAKYTLDGKFVMHNAVRGTPGIQRHLATVSFVQWLKTTTYLL